MRSEEEKTRARKNKNKANLKEEFEVWEDRPNLIKSEILYQPKQAWIPSIFYLESHKQIVRVEVET